jgi:hypothetical protein
VQGVTFSFTCRTDNVQVAQRDAKLALLPAAITLLNSQSVQGVTFPLTSLTNNMQVAQRDVKLVLLDSIAALLVTHGCVQQSYLALCCAGGSA